jgi:hypothetical protein
MAGDAPENCRRRRMASARSASCIAPIIPTNAMGTPGRRPTRTGGTGRSSGGRSASGCSVRPSSRSWPPYGVSSGESAALSGDPSSPIGAEDWGDDPSGRWLPSGSQVPGGAPVSRVERERGPSGVMGDFVGSSAISTPAQLDSSLPRRNPPHGEGARFGPVGSLPDYVRCLREVLQKSYRFRAT